VTHHSPGDLRRSEPSTRFNILDCLGFEVRAVLCKERSDVSEGPESAQCQERIIHVTETRVRILDNAAERLKDMALPFEYGTHATIKWQAAQIGAPRNANVPEAALQGSGE
jgi:hypothetical protein